MGLLLRVGSAFLGFAAGLLAVTVPIFAILENWSHVRFPFWQLVGIWFFVLVISGFFASLSYACFRYGMSNRNTAAKTTKGADRLFRSIGAASITALLAGVVSQVILLVVAAIRVRRWPNAVRQSVQIGWGPADWQYVRDSPYFLLLVFVLAAAAFHWEYRRASRAIRG